MLYLTCFLSIQGPPPMHGSTDYSHDQSCWSLCVTCISLASRKKLSSSFLSIALFQNVILFLGSQSTATKNVFLLFKGSIGHLTGLLRPMVPGDPCFVLDKSQSSWVFSFPRPSCMEKFHLIFQKAWVISAISWSVMQGIGRNIYIQVDCLIPQSLTVLFFSIFFFGVSLTT